MYGGICIMMHFLFVHFSSGHSFSVPIFSKQCGGEAVFGIANSRLVAEEVVWIVHIAFVALHAYESFDTVASFEYTLRYTRCFQSCSLMHSTLAVR